MPSRIFSLIAILCLLTAGSVWSQDTRGTITGRVTDPSGAVIAGAKVVVTNAAMGTKIDLTTNAEGIYRAPLPVARSLHSGSHLPGLQEGPCATRSKSASPTVSTSASRWKSALRNSRSR